MKYFRWSEWDIKWRMSWKNFFLYMASIPNPNGKKYDQKGREIKYDHKGEEIKYLDLSIENWC